MNIDERLLSRKFIATAFLMVAALVLFAMHRMTAAEYIEYMKWVLGLYMVGNVGAKAADTIKVIPNG